MLQNLIYGIQWLVITGLVMSIGMFITITIALIIQAIVYRTTKISLYNRLMKSLLK